MLLTSGELLVVLRFIIDNINFNNEHFLFCKYLQLENKIFKWNIYNLYNFVFVMKKGIENYPSGIVCN